MKAEVINLMSPVGQPEVRLTHGEEELTFSVGVFQRDSFKKEFDVFKEINEFWATLSEKEQEHVFTLYRDIIVLLNTVWERYSLTQQLSEAIKKLLDFHDYERMLHWVMYQSSLVIPESFEKDYQESIDKKGSRDQTYLKSDYIRLITLALTLRTMVPIWGEFIFRTKREAGTTFKEFYAFQLIGKSKLINTEPFDKLRLYIEKTVGSEAINPLAIIEHINSEDFPMWILSLVAIRKLCVGDISGMNPSGNIVTSVFGFVRQKMKSNDTPSENIIKNKTYTESSSDLDAKLSSLERYKLKYNISLGEIIELEYSTHDLYGVARRLSGQISNELLDRSIKSASQLNRHRLLDPQIMLLRWIMKPVISPRGIVYLNKETIIKQLGLAQAVLWARGHKYLALLITSFANIDETEMRLNSSESRARIPKELNAELDRLYPFQKIVGGKKTGQKPINLAVKSIETLADNLSMFSWNMTADEGLVTEVFGNYNSRRISINYDIKIQLAELVIELGNRNWN